ncbi:hypothetical protein C5167_019965, partial [Papaver somniferum]
MKVTCNEPAEVPRSRTWLKATRSSIPGDQLAIWKETGHRLGMGKDEPLGLPVDELIEKAYGFAGFLR